jgi:hypothetical protein
VSRGLLHYYFEDNEDVASKGLAFGFGPMWDSSIESLSTSRSSEKLVNGMIEILKRNLHENPDFTSLLFEMWVISRRSNMISKVFQEGLEEVISRFKNLLEFASSLGVVKVKAEEVEGVVRMLFAIYRCMAIQLIFNPEKAKDNRRWVPIRRILLTAFKG